MSEKEFRLFCSLSCLINRQSRCRAILVRCKADVDEGRQVSTTASAYFQDAAAVLGCEDVNAFLNAMGRSIGAPWQTKHKLAAAAALSAARRRAL
jgi:hypothetical protein